MLDTLTPVEQEVLRCTLRRLTQEQTANRLNLSQGTVQESLQSIYRKVGVTSNLELLLCFCSGMVTIAESGDTAA